MVNVVLFKELVTLVGFPLLRSFSGWLAKSSEDGKFTEFEFRQLLKTLVKVGSMSFVGYLGLGAMSVDNAALIAGAGSFFVDKLVDSLKESKRK